MFIHITPSRISLQFFKYFEQKNGSDLWYFDLSVVFFCSFQWHHTKNLAPPWNQHLSLIHVWFAWCRLVRCKFLNWFGQWCGKRVTNADGYVVKVTEDWAAMERLLSWWTETHRQPVSDKSPLTGSQLRAGLWRRVHRWQRRTRTMRLCAFGFLSIPMYP